MANGNDNGKITKFFNELSMGFKVVIAVLTIAAFVGGGIWQLNTTYASKGYVQAVETHAEKGRMLLAEESVKTLQQFQDRMRQEQIQRQIKNDVRYWTQLIFEVNYNIKDLENQLNIQPNDTYLKSRLQEERRRLEQYRQKLDEVLK